jgi:peptide/nickel transport system substrate-binding protein
MKRLALALTAALVAGIVIVKTSAGSSAQTPKRGGTVVIALRVEPTCLNVVLPQCLKWPLYQVLEGAFETADDFTYRPSLVSSVDVREEPFRLTYHIRPSARWSDGTPVTASDFVFTFKALADPKVGYFGARDYGAIRRIQAVDAKTLRVSFRAPFPEWHELFHEVLPRHALSGEDLTRIWRDTIDNPRTGEPLGSGPFLVERLERGRQLTLVRNRRYWGPKPANLDRIVFRFVPGDLAALKSGQVDLFLPSTGPDAEGLEAIRQGVIRVLLSPGSSWEHFAIQLGANGHPALRSRLVRRALAYGVDREAIVRSIYGLIAPRKGPLDSAVLPRQGRYYEPHWNVYRYRPAEARRLLEQAGCRRGSDAVYVCGGRRLSLRFLTTGGWPPRELTLRLVQAQLRKAGVEVVPEYLPPQTLLTTVIEKGDFDVMLFAWAPGARMDQGIGVFSCKGPQNYAGYCNRRVSQDLRRSGLEVEPQRRAALLNRVDTQLARDVPVIPLYQASYGVALRRVLRGVAPADPPDYLTWNSEDWWLER